MADKILIVEDEMITAADLHDTLRDLGYQIMAIVSTGAEAIAQAERDPPDIALMDIRIKGEIDGAETARILRERFDIPVVYLTAHADRETLNRAKQSSPLGYIVKPFQKAELQANIEIALDSNRQARKYQERYQRLTDVLSAVILGIISVDDREIVVLLNSGAEDLTGWSQGEAVGGGISRVLRLMDASTRQPLPLPLDEVLRQGSLAEFGDALLLKKTGETTQVVGNIAPVRTGSGGVAGAVIVFETVVPRHDDAYLKIHSALSDPENSLTFGSFKFIAASRAMKQLLAYAVRAARSEVPTILIEGETGTGKDLLAQFIHYASSRRTGPFVPVNCSAIPEALLESELFGHHPGAYTDARSLKKGLFEAADGGTLFLDEIGDMTPQMQAKLLRVVEEKSFRRLGGTQNITVDVRVIAATNRPLAAAVREGLFRLDLYHRLSVIQIRIQPLRERRDGILPLAQHFLSVYRRSANAQPQRLSASAANLLLAHDWPGNVRELRNVIERAVMIEDTDVIEASSIQFTMQPPAHPSAEPEPEQPDADLSLDTAERSVIRRALDQAHGNQTQAAALLGITRDVLRHRMKKFGWLKPPR